MLTLTRRGATFTLKPVAAYGSAQYVVRQSWTRWGSGPPGESQPKLMPEEHCGNAAGARYRLTKQETVLGLCL